MNTLYKAERKVKDAIVIKDCYNIKAWKIFVKLLTNYKLVSNFMLM